jgi:hypothetical protein
MMRGGEKEYVEDFFVPSLMLSISHKKFLFLQFSSSSSSPTQAHLGSVWRVVWAHPEFGQLLATCSFDNSAVVWEEVVEGGRKNMGSWLILLCCVVLCCFVLF